MVENVRDVAVVVEPVDGGPWGGQVVNLGGPPPEPAALTVGRPGIRLVPPAGNALTGKIRLRVNGEGQGIARVELRLGDRTAGSCATVPSEAEVDLMRYSEAAPPAVMRYLLVELLFWAKREGFRSFNLGMVPLAGIRRSAVAPMSSLTSSVTGRWERAVLIR